MTLFILILVITGIALILYGIFNKNSVIFNMDYFVKKYGKKDVIRANRIGSIFTGLCCFFLSILFFLYDLNPAYIFLILIIRGLSEFIVIPVANFNKQKD